MFPKYFLIFFGLYINSLISSPIFFIFENSSPIQKKILHCAKWENKNNFQFKEKQFELIGLEELNKDLLKSAQQSAKARMAHLSCINNIIKSKEDKEELKKSLELSKDSMLTFFEYYNRWLFSFEKKNIMTPLDKKYTSEVLTLKYDLYNLLHSKTKEILLSEETIKMEELEHYESQIISIYLSILKGNLDYYSVITPEFRKEILKIINQ